MKTKLLSLLVALIATTALWASNTITYMATGKLTKSTLNVDKTTFGPVITSHTFSNGIGTITCSGEITSIGDYAFSDCSRLTSITIPNSVTTIGDYAFRDCNGLTSITIPNSVTTIGSEAFFACSGLTSVTIPNSVTTIGNRAFSGCYGLKSPVYNNTIFAFMPTSYTGAYTIPDGITQIAGGAFCECGGLTSITIPNSVTTIGSSAFYDCRSLTSITIPNSVTTIGDDAFIFCKGLTSVTIPNSVTTIGSYAFSYCSGLTSVTIPNSVTTIGQDAFYNVNNIVYSGIATGSPWGAKCMNGYIEGYLVYSDANKTTLVGCFTAATGSITIPSSVTTIGGSAFSNCNGLTSVTIPNSVTTIGNEAFWNCSGLTSVTIPTSVTTIGGSAFYDCSSIKTVFNGSGLNITKGSTNNGYVAFYADTVYNWMQVGDYCIRQDTLVKFVGEISNISIPNGIKTIGNSAFANCSTLTSVVIPNSVETIGESAFANCTYLTDIVIGANVTEIGCNAFAGDFRIEEITSFAALTPNVCTSTFDGLSKDYIYLFVPANSVRKYQIDPNWNVFDIQTKSAETTPIESEQPVVTPSASEATITWPQTDDADTYTLEIKKNGELVCILTFNSQGQLINIAFTLARNNERPANYATKTLTGYQFTVTSLESGTAYTYAVTAKNASQQVLQTYSGDFTTTGGTATDLLPLLYEDNSLPFREGLGVGFVKFIHNGRLLIERNGILYNAHGARVK